MKKRFFSILLSLCMVLMLLPVTAFAETPSERYALYIVFDHGTLNGKQGSICKGTNYKAGDKYDIQKDVCGDTGYLLTDYEPYEIVGWTNLTGTFLKGDIYARAIFKLSAPTINGANQVCSQQDYEFTVTAAKGLSVSEFSYTVGEAKYTDSITEQDGVLYGLIPASVYASDIDSFTLSVTGTAPSGETATDSKTVKVIPDHNFAHGVCTICGAQQEFTLSVPFTTTVELGGNTAPGETTFDLAIVGANAGEERYADVTVSGSVTTDGAGDYTGTLTLTGPADQLWNMLCEGAFVQQVNAGEEGWTYDDTVWGLLLSQFVASSSADSAEYTMLILPATCKETDDGVYYDLDWEAESLDEMSFTNIYTKSTTKPAEPTESTRPTTNNTNTGVTTSVQTGDNSNLMLWLVLFAVSAIGAIGTGVYNKRRRNSRTK